MKIEDVGKAVELRRKIEEVEKDAASFTDATVFEIYARGGRYQRCWRVNEGETIFTVNKSALLAEIEAKKAALYKEIESL